MVCIQVEKLASLWHLQQVCPVSDDRMCVPGLKPGQRKVLFTCLKRNDKREVKVAQLAGSVAEMSAYHHGEVRAPFPSLFTEGSQV